MASSIHAKGITGFPTEKPATDIRYIFREKLGNWLRPPHSLLLVSLHVRPLLLLRVTSSCIYANHLARDRHSPLALDEANSESFFIAMELLRCMAPQHLDGYLRRLCFRSGWASSDGSSHSAPCLDGLVHCGVRARFQSAPPEPAFIVNHHCECRNAQLLLAPSHRRPDPFDDSRSHARMTGFRSRSAVRCIFTITVAHAVCEPRHENLRRSSASCLFSASDRARGGGNGEASRTPDSGRELL
jgi:hypothetical protein